MQSIIHKHNVNFNKTVTKLVIILTKSFFAYMNPTSYLKVFSALECSDKTLA